MHLINNYDYRVKLNNKLNQRSMIYMFLAHLYLCIPDITRQGKGDPGATIETGNTLFMIFGA